MNNYQLDCCQEPVVVAALWQPRRVRGGCAHVLV